MYNRLVFNLFLKNLKLNITNHTVFYTNHTLDNF